MRLFSNFLNKLLSSAVSLSIAVTAVPFTAAPAIAAPACANAYLADTGQDAACGAARIGGRTVTYPKLQWERVSDMPLTERAGSAQVVGSNEALALANRSAKALGLNASDVASAVTLFPSNVPFLVARYNPLDATLRVDLFKLEKSLTNGQKRASLFMAPFTPATGDYWKASRSYIHPASFKAGLTPGVNPFEAFKRSTSDVFHNISMSAAQVAVGHAMRFAGAPVALLQVASPRLSQRTESSGNAFRRKTTTIISGHAKPRWFIAQPAEFMSRSTTLAQAGYCAPDPDRTECAGYETATSGVSFEEFDGGMLSSAENTWELARHSKSGWGFLTILIVAVIGSFALAALAPAVMGTAAAGAAGAGAAGSAAAGMFGNFLVTQGVITGFTSVAAAAAVEAAYIAASLAVVSGANLSSMMTLGPETLLGYSTVIKGTASAGNLDEYQGKLNQRLVGLTQGSFAHGGNVLTGFATTVYGNCAPDQPLSTCTGANGVVQRVDQYDEHNMVEFIRDNNGQVVRHDKPNAHDDR